MNQNSADENSGRDRSDPYFKRSILLPGWGQIHAGRNLRGYVFLAAEVALLGSYFFLKRESAWLKDDYIAYAQQHGGITGSHSHQFYVDIGNWDNSHEFNEQRLRNREFDSLYRLPQDQWEWTSDEHRKFFEGLRVDSDHAKQTAVLMIGGLFLNHLISAVDASGLGKNRSELSMKQMNNSGVGINLSIR